jgi:hypothetical protein
VLSYKAKLVLCWIKIEPCVFPPIESRLNKRTVPVVSHQSIRDPGLWMDKGRLWKLAE